MTPAMCRVVCTLLLVLAPLAAADAEEAFGPRFYVFQNGLGFGGAGEEAGVLKELGYDGVAQVGVGKLAERVAAYEAVGLKVLSVYLNVEDEPTAADVVRPPANRGAMIELTVRRMTPKTVAAVRQTAATADELGVRVALYPHHGFAVATMPQALDLAAKVDHANLGVMFNLCHFLKNERAADLEAVLKRAKPRLFAVSTCGADLDGNGWNTLIQPLDRGTFPQRRLLKALETIDFDGPVSLQCYGVKGDKRENLRRSMAAWKGLLATDE